MNMGNMDKYDTVASANEGAVMTLLDPINTEIMVNEDDGSEMTIKLLGQDSDRYRKADLAATNRRLKVGGRKGGQVTAEELESADLSKLLAVTVEWNITSPSGERLKGAIPQEAQGKLRDIYRKWPWLKQDAIDFVTSRSNFVRASTTS